MTESNNCCKFQSYFKCLFLVSGIYICFLSYGFYLEKLLKFKVSSRVTFKYPIFIVVVTSASNLLISAVLLLLEHSKCGNLLKGKLCPHSKSGAVKTSGPCLLSTLQRKHLLRLCVSSSFSVVAQMTSNYALPYIGIPTQVIIKSSKMVPILIGGFLLYRRRYAWYDVLCVATISFALVLFNLSRILNYKSNKSSVVGIFLCFMSLICDGFVGPIQDEVLSKVHLHPYFLMFMTNLVALPFSLVVCLFTEKLTPFFLLKNKEVLKLVTVLSLSGSFGQLFVFSSLTSYGSLYTGIITTLRKAFTTLLSVHMFKHRVTNVQWFAVLLTFTSIFMQQYFKNKAKAPRKVKAA